MKLYDDKYIVLTGGAGFIGSSVLEALGEMGMDNIVVVDDLGEGEKWKNLVGKKFLDVLHKDQLFEWLEGKETDIEAFIHLGACSSTIESNAHYLLENNYQYSVRLAEYALQNEHRFIYASSAATYGDRSLGFSDDHEMLDQLRPMNMYGFSKHLFDLWLKRQNLLDKVVGLKYFNVFGPNETHKGRMASVVPKFYSDIKSSGKIRLFKSSEPEKYGDGEQVRDFIYVKDAARMTTQFLTADQNGIFNIGLGQANTWNSLVQAIGTAVDQKLKVEYIPMPEDLIGIYQNYTCADTSKYKKEKLYSPQYSLEEGVIDYVRNYLVKGQYL